MMSKPCSWSPNFVEGRRGVGGEEQYETQHAVAVKKVLTHWPNSPSCKRRRGAVFSYVVVDAGQVLLLGRGELSFAKE
jgi:hypothetical protein